jgi:hypothetical protein
VLVLQEMKGCSWVVQNHSTSEKVSVDLQKVRKKFIYLFVMKIGDGRKRNCWWPYVAIVSALVSVGLGKIAAGLRQHILGSESRGARDNIFVSRLWESCIFFLPSGSLWIRPYSSKHCVCPLYKFIYSFKVVKLFLKHPIASDNRMISQ